jgi:hypothetical protein
LRAPVSLRHAIHAILVAGTAAFALAANAEKLPPIGKRAYVIDTQDPAAPVTIEKDGKAAGKAVVLKDPVHPSGPIKLVPLKKTKPKPVARAKPVPMKPGRLRFGAVTVSGHLKKPRVEFTRDVLPVERADELEAPDFFQKVYEPARRDDF